MERLCNGFMHWITEHETTQGSSARGFIGTQPGDVQRLGPIECAYRQRIPEEVCSTLPSMCFIFEGGVLFGTSKQYQPLYTLGSHKNIH